MPASLTLPVPVPAADRPSGTGGERRRWLRELVQQLPAATVEGPLDREFQGLTHDSRRVRPGLIFAAIPGQHTDGHEYIGSAVDRGAVAVLCEQHRLVPPRATCIRVPDVRVAMAVAARFYHGNPSARLKVLGVTGTSGKTTVAFMIKAIMEAAGLSTGLISSVRHEIGERVLPATLTTPEAPDLQQMLAQMVRAGCGACVLEVSSHALDQQRVLGVDFDVAVFTNLTRAHLDYHGTMEGYFAAKQKLFAGLAAGPKRAAAVINIDDDFGARLAGTTKVDVELNFGLRQSARLRATRIELEPRGSRFVVEAPGRRFAVRLPLAGRQNLYNALAAIGVGLALEVDVVHLQAALNALPPVPGRLERVEAGQPFAVFVDAAASEAALRHALQTLREITRGRLLLAVGCAGGRDPHCRGPVGAAAAALADFTVITSDNPRCEDPALIAARIEEGCCSVRPGACAIELDRRRAIARILDLARPGDVVLLAGKGHETYQEFEHTVVPFDDRAEALAALAALGWAGAIAS